jgi:hypothetical protein
MLVCWYAGSKYAGSKELTQQKILHSSFFILHSSFFIEFCEAKFLWASRFASQWLRHCSLASGYPLHHASCFQHFGVVPLLSLSQKCPASLCWIWAKIERVAHRANKNKRNNRYFSDLGLAIFQLCVLS